MTDLVEGIIEGRERSAQAGEAFAFFCILNPIDDFCRQDYFTFSIREIYECSWFQALSGTNENFPNGA